MRLQHLPVLGDQQRLAQPCQLHKGSNVSSCQSCHLERCVWPWKYLRGIPPFLCWFQGRSRPPKSQKPCPQADQAGQGTDLDRCMGWSCDLTAIWSKLLMLLNTCTSCQACGKRQEPALKAEWP